MKIYIYVDTAFRMSNKIFYLSIFIYLESTNLVLSSGLYIPPFNVFVVSCDVTNKSVNGFF